MAPPTIHKDPSKERKDPEKEKREQSLICKVKYCNTLPDIPFDPKSLIYPFESNRFIQYNPTSLERGYKHELLTENDLGITVDLVNLDLYKPNPSDRLAPEDEFLLEDEVSAPTDAKRSRHHNKNVSWLRKTEYISTELTNKFKKTEKAESRIGFNMRRLLKEEQHLYRDRQSQIDAIEATFEAARKPITKHHSKPNVHAVDVLPLLPDFDIWRHPCAQVIFDNDPARKDRSVPEQMEEMHQAMIRGMVDESGDQFVAYFLPTDETKRKRKRDMEEGMDYNPVEEYEFDLAREYNWNVKNKTMRGYEENYFFVIRERGVFYNELETRVRLSKRRKLGGGAASSNLSRTKLVVRHREFTDVELKAQASRLGQLELEGEEEDEEEEEEEDEEEEEPSGTKQMDAMEAKNDDGSDEATDDEEDASDKSGDEKRSIKAESPRKRQVSGDEARKDAQSDDEEEDEDEQEESGSEMSSSDEEEAKAENSRVAVKPKAPEEGSSEAESSSSEDESPQKRLPQREASSGSSSEEEEEEDEEEEGEDRKKAEQSAVERQKQSEVQQIFGEESSEESSEEEEEEDEAPRPPPQVAPRTEETSSSDSDSSSDVSD